MLDLFDQASSIHRLQRLPDLPWPKNLFAPLFASANSTAPLLGKRQTNDHLCSCGKCGLPHKHAVSRVVGDSGARRVIWYANLRCRNADAPRWDT